MTAQELPLQVKLIEYLKSRSRIRLTGPATTGLERVPTISFVHESKSSREIVLAVNEKGVGIRYGHFYAYRLARALGLNPDDGVVRASLLHYNSQSEVDRLIELLDPLI
jgi:selenocysteine lyase/cysteine desulfurase